VWGVCTSHLTFQQSASIYRTLLRRWLCVLIRVLLTQCADVDSWQRVIELQGLKSKLTSLISGPHAGAGSEEDGGSLWVSVIFTRLPSGRWSQANHSKIWRKRNFASFFELPRFDVPSHFSSSCADGQDTKLEKVPSTGTRAIRTRGITSSRHR
jgi:hypothetical protein